MNDAMETIRKLLRLANNPGATEGEVQAAMGRVQHLAALHNISSVEIERATRSDGTEGVRISVDAADMVQAPIWIARSLSRWDKWLLRAARSASNCGGFIGWKDGRPALYVYGLPADVEVARELFAFMRDTLSTCARRWAKEQRASGLPWVTGASVEVRSYKDGFCSGLIEAADKGGKPGEQMRIGHGDCTALVAVSDVVEAKRAALTCYRRQNLRLGRARRINVRTSCSQSHSAGRRQGRQTNVSRNVVR